jgi:chromosome segregation ATPase
VEWGEAEWRNLEYKLDMCPEEMDTLHQKKEEELSNHQEYQAKLAYEVEKAQAERNNLNYKLEFYQKKLDTLRQEKEKEILNHKMEKLHLDQMLANQIEHGKTLMHIFAFIHGDLSSIWANVITLVI